MPPIVYPQITIDGRTYTLKPDGLYDYFTDMWGVDFSTLAADLGTDRKTGKFAIFLKLFAGLTAHNFVLKDQPVLTPEQWALKITRDRVKEIIDLVILAITPKKTQPEEVKQANPPAVEPGAPPVQ